MGVPKSDTQINILPMRTKVVHNKSMIRTLKNTKKKARNDQK